MELREAISRYIGRLYGVRYDVESEIIVTVGVSEAMYLAMTAVLNPGDEVIIPEPCFVSYAPEVSFAGGVPVTVPTYFSDQFPGDRGSRRSGDHAPKTKAILLGYPNNPTGAVMTHERMLEIAAVAEQHDLLIISDEIYSRLVYGVDHTCVPALPACATAPFCSTVSSKSHAMTGWRLGFACAHPDILGAMRKIHQYTIMSAPTTAQAAVL